MRVKLKTKLIALFILLGLIPFLLIGIYSYIKSREALKSVAFERLVSIRDMKKSQIEDYLKTIDNQVISFSENGMIVEAMKEFTTSFFKIEEEMGTAYRVNEEKNEKVLKARYAYQKKNTPDAPEEFLSRWWPSQLNSRILQHLYISSNSYEIGEKHKLVKSGDNSSYSKTHEKYHPVISSFLEKFGFYDIFLVEPEKGYIVYSVHKEVDFGTSLKTGPYSNSNIAEVFESALGSDKKDFLSTADFKPYEPSYNSSAAFIASPVFDGNKRVGVLIFQMPIGKINDIMTNSGKWEKVGLGKSGESYLVGDDFKMRSDSRMLIEEREKFFRFIKDTGVEKETLSMIKKHNTTIGILEIKNDDIDEALEGETHHSESALNYLGIPSLIAHALVETEGFKWAIITEIAVKEAFAATYLLRKTIWILGIIVSIVVIFIALYFARTISVPLNRIIGELSTTSTQIASTINEHERIASQQSSSVNETTTTMDELAASSRQSSEQADLAASGTQQALSIAEQGNNSVEKMQEGMNSLKEKVNMVAEQILKLSEQTNQIGNITAMVTDFANETKMLSMNASVEAVRAGEHGKGFSVVAMEIRKLAEESKRSAEKINKLVADIQKSTNSTVMMAEEGTKTVDSSMTLASETVSSFNGVAMAINSASESAQQISLNIKQQAAAVKQVVEAMSSLNSGAKETASGITQTKTAIEKLNEAAQILKEMI